MGEAAQCLHLGQESRMQGFGDRRGWTTSPRWQDLKCPCDKSLRTSSFSHLAIKLLALQTLVTKMPLPRSFLPLVKSTRFWTDYLFLTDTPYPPPLAYKAAFQHADDDSDENSDENSEENLDQDSNDQITNNQDDAPDDLQSPTDNASQNSDSDGEASDNQSTSYGSGSGSPRPRSPLLYYNLVFPFNRDLDPTDQEFNLAISIDPILSYIPLTFHAPDVYDVRIAHDDQAHWHPFVLKWGELEAISRAVALTVRDEDQEGLYQHPGLPLLFLYRFAPICQGDDIDRIVVMLARAWKRVLGAGVSDRDVRRLIERMDCRGRGFRWFKEGENWWIGEGENAETAEEVYTYRSKESVRSGKWLSQEWNQFVEEARAVVEGAGGDEVPTSEEDCELAARFVPRPRHSLNVWLALREKDRPLSQRAGRYFYLTLDGVLRILDMGGASSSGASSCTINGRSVYTSDHSSVTIYGSLERGRAMIKQMLWWLCAPLATTLRDGSTYHELPLDLADETQDSTEEAYLGICVPDILPDCSWLVSHTLPDTLHVALESNEVLQGTAQLVPTPTSDGWFTVKTTDGGELGFNFSRFDGEAAAGTGALGLRQVTPQASAVLHRLMEVSGAVLTPVALTAKPLREDIAEISWVPHRVVDSETLHGILSPGAFELWTKAERKDDAANDSDEEPSTPRW